MKHLKYLLIVFMLLVLSSPALADDPDFDFDSFEEEESAEEVEATSSDDSLESEDSDLDASQESIQEFTEETESTSSDDSLELENFDFDSLEEESAEETESTSSNDSLELENFDFDTFDDNVEATDIEASQNQCVTLVDSNLSNAKGSYEVCFEGVDYGNDDSSTWTYSITNKGAQGLSHWTLNLCEAPVFYDKYVTIGRYGDTTGRKGISYPVSWGQDKSTFGQGVPVFKYDSGMDDGQTDIFQFTMGSRYDTLSDLKIATKSGKKTGIAFGTIIGPDCNKTTPATPTPTPTPAPATPTPATPTPTAPKASCVSTAFADNYGRGGGHAVYLRDIGNHRFFFEPAAQFVENAEDGSATIIGTIYSDYKDIEQNNGFDIEINFRNRTTQAMRGSPKKELTNNPYSTLVDTTSWYYYQDFSGTLTGVPGGKYEGAKINLSRRGPNFQVGVGANGKNLSYGASSWTNWRVVQQPNQGSLIAKGKGDINFNITNCADAPGVSSLGDLVWRDTNKNGIQDAGEEGIGDVTVQLFDADTDSLINTDITDADGRYLFDNLGAGNYFVRLPTNNFLDTGRLAGFTVSPLDAGNDNGIDSDGQEKNFVGKINVAKGKSATQSSTGNWYGVDPNASRAIDGNNDGDYSNGSVAHTNKNTNAWWEVDLGQVYDLSSVKIWNRTDCCSYQLSNFYVFVSDEPFSSKDLETTKNQAGVTKIYFDGTAGRQTKLDVNRTGRYVRIQITKRNTLALAEVEIFTAGEPTTDKMLQTVDINLPISTDDMSWDFGVYEDQATAITLDYFDAAVNGQEVTLNWATATEVDNAGFNIYRATSADGEYSRINDALITAKGTVYGGAAYSLMDTPGEGEFFYILEDVDYYNNATSYAPVRATIAASTSTQLNEVDR